MIYDASQYTVPTGKLKLFDLNPNYNITFHRDGKEVGRLDFNGPEMVFSGDFDESAKTFLEFIAQSFSGRLEQERLAEREACAKVCDDIDAEYEGEDVLATWCSRAIRARGQA